MEKYREIQSGAWMVVLLIIALLTIILLSGSPENISSNNFRTAVLASFVLLGVLFYRLKTEIAEDSIIISFGIGLIKKRIALSSITSAKVVRNHWMFGWGIRFIGKGWMWNIWGLNAVELNLKGKKSVFRIGSQRPQELCDFINKRLNRNVDFL